MKLKRFLSALLAFAMVLSVCPVVTFAAEDAPKINWTQETVDETAGIYRLVGHIQSTYGVQTILTALNFDNTVIQPVETISPYNPVELTAGKTTAAPSSVQCLLATGQFTNTYIPNYGTIQVPVMYSVECNVIIDSNANRTSIELSQYFTAATASSNPDADYMEFYFKVKDGQSLSATTFQFASMADNPIALAVQDANSPNGSWYYSNNWDAVADKTLTYLPAENFSLEYEGSDAGVVDINSTAGDTTFLYINKKENNGVYTGTGANSNWAGAAWKDIGMPMDLTNPGPNYHAQYIIPSNWIGETKESYISNKSGQSITMLTFYSDAKIWQSASGYSSVSASTMDTVVNAVKSKLQTGQIIVRVGETELDTLGTSATDIQYIDSGLLTKVFEGSPDILPYGSLPMDNSDYGWADEIIIPFDTPYEYKGGNIVVDIVMLTNDNNTANAWGNITNYKSTFNLGNAEQDSTKKWANANGTGVNWLPRSRVFFETPRISMTVTGADGLATDGTGKSPKVTVYDKVKNEDLVQGTDYTVTYTGRNDTKYSSYDAPIGGGDYTMTLNFRGSYKGTKSVDFTVVQGFEVNINIANDDTAYTGEAIKPEVTVTDKYNPERTLTLNEDYTITVNGGNDCINAGTYTVTVTEIGGEGKSQTATFTIKQAENSIKELSMAGWTYGSIPNDPVVQAAFGTPKLSYTLTGGNGQWTTEKPTTAGTWTVKATVAATDNWAAAEKTATFTIAQQDVNNGTVTTVKTYMLNDGNTIDSMGPVRLNSADNHTQAIIPATDLEGLKGKTLDSLTFYYGDTTGTGMTFNPPTMTVLMKEVDEPYFYSTSAFVSTEGMTEVFSGTVTKGTGNTMVLTFTEPYLYEGGNLLLDYTTAGSATSRSVGFYGVTRGNSDPTLALWYYDALNSVSTNSFIPKMTFSYLTDVPSAVEVDASNTELTYNGTAQAPSITVTDGDKTLAENTDYTVSGGDAINAGTYTATVTFQGNYSGTRTVPFTIAKAKITDLTVTMEGWHQGQTPNQPTINKTGVTATFTYRKNAESTYTSTVPTDPGTYYVMATVTETANYDAASAETNFTISAHQKTTVAAQAPGCETVGWDAYEYCSVEGCGYTTYVEQEALGHIEVKQNAQAPTCEEIGWNEYLTCERNCGYSTYVELPKRDHKDDNGDHRCDYEDCKAAMGAVTTVDTQTLTTASDKAAVYTATVNYSAGDITSLLLNDNEFFSLKDGVLKLCGSQVQGTYGVDTYTVKATVNSAQQLLMVEVRLSNGLVLRRGTYQLVSKNTTSYSVTAKAYDASDVSGIAISDQSITVEKYDIHDNASDVGLDDSLIADLSTTFSDARTTRNLAWTATATQMTFQYRVKGTTMWTEKAVTGSDNHFKADITGLQPDKTYEYQIVNGTEVSSIYEFTTAAAGNSGEFSFIAIGDTQGNEWAHTKYAEAAYAKALEKDANAKFILHTGDVVNDGGSDTQWSWFFKALDQNAANIPHFAAIGNHDMYDNGANFNEYFNHPNDGSTERLNSAYTGRIGDWVNNSDETFYSFDYGDAHFIVLHSGRYENGNVNTSDLDADMLNAQREWLIEDLSNNSHAKWTIVMVHQPSYHRLDEGAGADYSRPALADVFESYGVDLVIQGHSHLVTRTYPMVYDADTKTAGNVNTAAFIGGDPDRIARGEGTVYVTIGATTPFSRDSLGDLNMDHIMTIVTPFSTENYAANTAQASYTNVSVKNDKLTVTIRQLDGLVLDQFSIEGTYSGDDHTVITDAEVPATCTTPGKTAGSHCACGDILVAQTEIPAKGHAWTVSYDFADNGSACTATRICGNDASHNVSADAAITSAVTTPATCTVMGTTTYTATFTEDWAVTQTKAVQDVPTVAHTYGEPVFTWNGYECTATAKCTCGDELDVSVDVTFEVTTEATCNVEGIKTYTATAVVNDVTYTAAEHPTENIGMAANNHKNTETHAQDDATCTAVGYTAGEFCNDCQKWIEGHAEIPAINHKNQYAGEAKDATCTENGNTAGVYCPDCETWLTEQETIPAAHNLKYVAEVPATCVNAGNVAHYVCQVETCGKLFSDATGEEPIENVTLEATGNHTYGDDGKCTGCGADEPGQSTATIKAVSATLLYEDMIQVRYKFTVEANNAEVYGMYIFESKEDAETHDSTKAVQTKELVKYSDGYYGYTDGIAAKEMGDSQFVVGYLKLSDGTYIYGNVVEYSPKIYAQRMVDKDSTSAETKALCNALMHYGAAAQTYLKYKTDNLMNEGFAAVEYDASVLGESVFVVDTTETNGFTTKSANLLFEGAITYRIKYTAGSKIENKKLYLEYTVKGNTDSVELSYISDGYYGYISGIAAKDMDEALKAKPYYLDDSGNKVYGAELIYSGYEYSRRTISNSKDADSVALAKAFAMYVHAADIAIK